MKISVCIVIDRQTETDASTIVLKSGMQAKGEEWTD